MKLQVASSMVTSILLTLAAACAGGTSSSVGDAGSGGDAAPNEAGADEARAPTVTDGEARDARAAGDAYTIESCNGLALGGSYITMSYTADAAPEMKGGTLVSGKYQLTKATYYGTTQQSPGSMVRDTLYVEVGSITGDKIEGRWFEVFPPGDPNYTFREGYRFEADSVSGKLTFELFCEDHKPQANFSAYEHHYSVLADTNQILLERPGAGLTGTRIFEFTRE